MIKFQIITAVFLMFSSNAFAANGHDTIRSGGTSSYHSIGGGVYGSTPDDGNSHVDEITSSKDTNPREFFGVVRLAPNSVGIVTPNGFGTYPVPAKTPLMMPGTKLKRIPGTGGKPTYEFKIEPANNPGRPYSARKLDNRVTYSKGKKKTKRGVAEAKGIKLAIKHFTKGMSKKKKKKWKRKVNFVFFEFLPN